MAYAASGQSAPARVELRAVNAIRAETAVARTPFASGATGAQLLGIASKVLEARLAGEAGSWDEALGLLRAAVSMQDGLPYTEPPPWYFPNREALGNALLRAGKAAEAEEVFRHQLDETPRNGWSLTGLVASLRAQEKDAEADAAEAERGKVWNRADFELEAAVF